MRQVFTKIRDTCRNASRRIAAWYVREEPTNAQLGELVRNMELVVEMMKHPGWQVYRDSVLDRLDDQVDSTMLLPAEKFASVIGVESKGIAMGARMALNVAGEIVARGLEAEPKLKERLRKANAEQKKPAGSRLGVPSV